MTSAERAKRWRAANPKRVVFLKRRWYAANQERNTLTVRRYRQRNLEKVTEIRRNATYKHKYGITTAQYDKMLAAQKGVCKLCFNTPKKNRLAVDHCHKTKRVRGALCWHCNRKLIGRWRAEHADLLRRAADYLESEFDARNI